LEIRVVENRFEIVPDLHTSHLKKKVKLSHASNEGMGKRGTLDGLNDAQLYHKLRFQIRFISITLVRCNRKFLLAVTAGLGVHGKAKKKKRDQNELNVIFFN
jgi:hypothetical protein